MRVPRFFQPGKITSGQSCELSENNVQHVSKVLRMKPGQQLILFNGDGNEYQATISQLSKKQVTVTIDASTNPARESSLRIHIGQSISRGERMDYAVQKATETGMAEMTPLFSERCEVRLNAERQQKRQQHWQQIAVSACEQSLRTSVPEIHAPSSLEQWITSVEADLKLVLHHHTETPLQQTQAPASVALLIGPEGGLTEREVELAIESGFKPLAIGPRVFRTETAPVAAQSILQYLWGDFA